MYHIIYLILYHISSHIAVRPRLRLSFLCLRILIIPLSKGCEWSSGSIGKRLIQTIIVALSCDCQLTVIMICRVERCMRWLTYQGLIQSMSLTPIRSFLSFVDLDKKDDLATLNVVKVCIKFVISFNGKWNFTTICSFCHAFNFDDNNIWPFIQNNSFNFRI